MDETRSKAEESARRLAAAITGAIEGFLEGLEEHDVAEEAKRSLQTAGEVAREGGAAAREAAATPEMRELGEQLGRAGEATTQAATRATESVKAKVEDVRYGVRERIDDVKDTARDVKEGVKARAEAVAETGRRAKRAPGQIARELRLALSAWWGSIVTMLAMGVVVATFAIATLVVLTIALVVALDRLVGDPAGTFLVAGLYILIMLVAMGVSRSRRARARAEVGRRVEASKEHARYVARPVKTAFRGRGPGAG